MKNTGLNKLLLFITALLYCNAMSAQFIFQRTYGFSSLNEGRSVIEGFDSGYIICGTTSVNNSDVYVIYLNDDGTIRWQKTFGGSRIDNSNCIIKTADSCYVICGSSNSFSSNNDYDFYLLKINRTGDLIWQKNYGGTDWDFGYKVKQAPDNSFILAGNTYNGASGNSDGMTLKTDSAGNIVWTKIFYSLQNDLFNSLDITAAQEVVLSGVRTDGINNTKDIIAAKVNSSGDSLFYKIYGSDADEEALDIDCRDGFCLLAGDQFDGSGLNNLSLTISESGDSVSTKLLVLANDEITTALDYNSLDSTYWFTGYTTSFGGGKKDMFISKADTSGNDLGGSTYGNLEDEIGYSVHATGDGGAIATGLSNTYGPGNQSLYVVKIDSDLTTSAVVINVNEINNIKESINIYPNPAYDIVNVVSTTSDRNILSYELTDVTGRIFTKGYFKNSKTVNLKREEIASGFYFLKIISDDGIFFSKSIILN